MGKGTPYSKYGFQLKEQATSQQHNNFKKMLHHNLGAASAISKG
jgi:hypothetical protein